MIIFWKPPEPKELLDLNTKRILRMTRDLSLRDLKRLYHACVELKVYYETGHYPGGNPHDCVLCKAAGVGCADCPWILFENETCSRWF